MYGVDVALTRADDLDKKLLKQIEMQVSAGYIPKVLDLGCGAGGQSVRMAQGGATVLGVDVTDYTEAFSDFRITHGFNEKQLQFIQSDVRAITEICQGQTFDMVLAQRVVHYVQYEEARILLRQLTTVAERLYISVTGLESDIGAAYAAGTTPIQQRFERLTPEAQTTFSITEPICLYTPEEFIALLTESGWHIDECWVSAFGNTKGVCNIVK